MKYKMKNQVVPLYIFPTKSGITFEQKGWPIITDEPQIQVNHNGLSFCLSFGEKVELYVAKDDGNGNMSDEVAIIEFENEKVNVKLINNE